MQVFGSSVASIAAIAAFVMFGCGDDTAADGGGEGDGSSSGLAEGSDDAESSDVDTSATGDDGTTTDVAEGTAGTDDGDSTGSATTDADASTGGGSSDEAGSESETGDDDDAPAELCEAPGSLQPCDDASDDPWHALGLDCPGLPDERVPLLGSTVNSQDDRAWRVARQLGSAIDPATLQPVWSPREGDKFLLISSGLVSEPDEAGAVIENPGTQQSGQTTNDNADDKALPAPMTPQVGSNAGSGGSPFQDCDGVHDCSDSLQEQWQLGSALANDLMWMQMDTLVPGGTYGYSFDFAYFSAEFPEYVGDVYNDMFVVWSDSEAYTGNLCFVDDQPCTVTALWPVAFTSDAPELVGTGFDVSGEATGWFQVKGIAEPGEVLQVTFAVFDMGDTVLTTVVLMDNYQWDCEGCAPSEVDPCIGVIPV